MLVLVCVLVCVLVRVLVGVLVELGPQQSPRAQGGARPLRVLHQKPRVQLLPGTPGFGRPSRGGRSLLAGPGVEVREEPVTKYQSESPNEAGNT